MLSTIETTGCFDDIDTALAAGVDIKSTRVEPQTVLMCPATYFDVIDCKNPFMGAGINRVDRHLAGYEWEKLRAVFASLGRNCRTIEPAPDLEDMVFTANQVLPFLDSDGEPAVVLSNMKHASRSREVPFFQDWFYNNDYRIYLVSSTAGAVPCFEGQGDAIWHPETNLLWGGYGFRTEAVAYEQVSRIVSAPVLRLKLKDPRFYHLDTAFAALDRDHVMIYPEAFEEGGLHLIRHYFKNVIEVSASDAENFACNSVCIDRNVILQRGSQAVCQALVDFGFKPVEVETGEFMKSGGSVFCLKMMVY